MTREEKIAELINIRDNFNYTLAPREVFDDAIKVLEQEPCEDAISRTDVLEAISELNSTTFGQVVSRTVRNLPPVNPQICEEAISRQATIEAFQMFRGYEANRTNAEWVDRIETVVKKLPPVNPQPKTGHWIAVVDKWGDIVTTVNGYKCSECGEFDGFRDKFCPNCGAKMEDKE